MPLLVNLHVADSFFVMVESSGPQVPVIRPVFCCTDDDEGVTTFCEELLELLDSCCVADEELEELLDCSCVSEEELELVSVSEFAGVVEELESSASSDGSVSSSGSLFSSGS